MSYLTHSRTREDILEFVLECIPETIREKQKDTAIIEHIMWGIVCLQVVSRILTTLLHETHFWFSRKRDQSLNLRSLFKPVPKTLMKAAVEDAETWLSDEMEEYYWPALLRLYLSGGDVVRDMEHPLSYIAMSLSFKVLGPLLIRLLTVVDDAMVLSADVRKNILVQTTRKLLAGILRDKRPGPFETTDNQDPKNVIAHHLHRHYFTGELDALENEALVTLDKAIDNLTKSAGKDIAEIVHIAALKAGRAQILAFEMFEGKYADGSHTLARPDAEPKHGRDTNSMVSDVSYARRQDPLRLMQSAPYLDMLNDAMYRFMSLANDESMFETVIEEHIDRKDLDDPEDVFAAVPVHESKYKFGN